MNRALLGERRVPSEDQPNASAIQLGRISSRLLIATCHCAKRAFPVSPFTLNAQTRSMFTTTFPRACPSST